VILEGKPQKTFDLQSDDVRQHHPDNVHNGDASTEKQHPDELLLY